MEWIFYICLLLGALFGSLSAFGGDGDGDGDSELSDVDDGEGSGVLGTIGWGRVPIFIALSIVLLIFGAVGLIAQKAGTSAVLASCIGFFAALILGGFLTRLMVKLVPAIETSNATTEDLKGLRAEVIYPQSPENKRNGMLSVTFKGDMYRFLYQSEERFKIGESVLILDIDPDTKICTVCADPTQSA